VNANILGSHFFLPFDFGEDGVSLLVTVKTKDASGRFEFLFGPPIKVPDYGAVLSGPLLVSTC
jgi:hypothetical protein